MGFSDNTEIENLIKIGYSVPVPVLVSLVLADVRRMDNLLPSNKKCPKLRLNGAVINQPCVLYPQYRSFCLP